ncbi:MAG: hypothetical protein R3B90_06650 [Planctomycetaceae bacterium]
MTRTGSLAELLLIAAGCLLLIEQVMAWRIGWGVATLTAVAVLAALWQSYLVSAWLAAALLLICLAFGVLLHQRLNFTRVAA